MRTQTHTYFWHLEDLEPTLTELDKLAEEWAHRRPHVSRYAQVRGDALLAQARASVALMFEAAE